MSRDRAPHPIDGDFMSQLQQMLTRRKEQPVSNADPSPTEAQMLLDQTPLRRRAPTVVSDRAQAQSPRPRSVSQPTTSFSALPTIQDVNIREKTECLALNKNNVLLYQKMIELEKFLSKYEKHVTAIYANDEMLRGLKSQREISARAVEHYNQRLQNMRASTIARDSIRIESPLSTVATLHYYVEELKKKKDEIIGLQKDIEERDKWVVKHRTRADQAGRDLEIINKDISSIKGELVKIMSNAGKSLEKSNSQIDIPDAAERRRKINKRNGELISFYNSLNHKIKEVAEVLFKKRKEAQHKIADYNHGAISNEKMITVLAQRLNKLKSDLAQVPASLLSWDHLPEAFEKLQKSIDGMTPSASDMQKCTTSVEKSEDELNKLKSDVQISADRADKLNQHFFEFVDKMNVNLTRVKNYENLDAGSVGAATVNVQFFSTEKISKYGDQPQKKPPEQQLVKPKKPLPPPPLPRKAQR